MASSTSAPATPARGASCTRPAARFASTSATTSTPGCSSIIAITRARVAAEPGARSLLNLFAYTGAFTVYAAAAGMATTSVDLSTTYLDWARANLALNGLPAGEVVHADVRAFLAEARRAGRAWDVAIVDPPTFSNSKRMDYTWDVQRDHAALLDDVRAVARVVWFSTNKKRFRFDAPGAWTNETAATTPPDFRHRPHHAFRLGDARSPRRMVVGRDLDARRDARAARCDRAQVVGARREQRAGREHARRRCAIVSGVAQIVGHAVAAQARA